MANEQQSQGQQMQIKAPDEALKGVYSNAVQISHTAEEFVLDFMDLFPPVGILSSRIIVSPGHVKRILAALSQNIKNFEEQFGQIKENPSNVPPSSTSSSGQNFGFDTSKAK
jgi:hypothetical protein